MLVKDAGERYGLSRYVAIVNLGDVGAKAKLELDELDLGGRAYVIDLVEKAEVGSFEHKMELKLKPHEAKFYRLFAEKRLPRRHYRADSAWMREFDCLSWSKDAPLYATMQPGPGEDYASVTAAVGLGRRPDNDLLWRDVRLFGKGAYKLSFDLVSNEPRSFFVSIDGGAPVELKVPAARWVQTASFEAELSAGSHEVRVFNDRASVPAIVGMKIASR